MNFVQDIKEVSKRNGYREDMIPQEPTLRDQPQGRAFVMSDSANPGGSPPTLGARGHDAGEIHSRARSRLTCH
uniref:Uncharacterized protein n=1 Tax=Cannabis sativa TaxID=3483 RepID=A0A803QF39_CANSA